MFHRLAAGPAYLVPCPAFAILFVGRQRQQGYGFDSVGKEHISCKRPYKFPSSEKAPMRVAEVDFLSGIGIPHYPGERKWHLLRRTWIGSLGERQTIE